MDESPLGELPPDPLDWPDFDLFPALFPALFPDLFPDLPASVRSGITTALELEAGAYPTGAYGLDQVGRSPVHFGASTGHFAVRARVVEGADEPCMVHSLSLIHI